MTGINTGILGEVLQIDNKREVVARLSISDEACVLSLKNLLGPVLKEV